jgi:predicted nuclease of predicted toxin-antitoxin system
VRWLADECVHAAVVRELRDAGHDVLYVSEQATQSRDLALVDTASADNRILLTDDKDFGEIVFREGRATNGIVLLRIPPARWRLMWPNLRDAISRHGDGLCQSFTVVEEGRIRTTRLARG